MNYQLISFLDGFNYFVKLEGKSQCTQFLQIDEQIDIDTQIHLKIDEGIDRQIDKQIFAFMDRKIDIYNNL